MALTTHFGGRFLYKKPGLCFIGISPFCRVLISITRPIFFSQNSIYIWNKNELSDSDLYEFDSFYHIPFKDIANVEYDGTRLTVNHNLSIDFYTSSVSKRIAEKILFLNSTPLARRVDEINSILKNDHDLEEIKKVTSNSQKLLLVLDILSALLFVDIFVLIPTGIYSEQAFQLKFYLVLTISVYLLAIMLSYSYLQKNLKLSMNSVGLLLHLLLYPVSTIHVAQNLSRHSLPSSDFVAVAAVFLGADDFRNILKKELKRIHFSKLKCKDEELIACIKLKEKYLHRFLPKAGLAIEDLFKQPGKRDLSAAGYCPLCEVEYIEGNKICPDCDIELIAYRYQAKS
jgi:hypothetical protein